MNQFSNRATLAYLATATSSYTSIQYALNGLTDFSLQVSFSDASLGGTLKLQATNFDLADNLWVDVADSSQTVTAGEGHMWNVEFANYEFVRFVWTRAAGTGTLTAHILVKGLQG